MTRQVAYNLPRAHRSEVDLAHPHPMMSVHTAARFTSDPLQTVLV